MFNENHLMKMKRVLSGMERHVIFFKPLTIHWNIDLSEDSSPRMWVLHVNLMVGKINH